MVPHCTLLRAPVSYDMPITWPRARELARGLREQIILEGNEDISGEGENENMTVDAREEERDVPE